MNIEMHPSVKKVAEFMQNELPADELLGVVAALAVVASAMWGRYPKQNIYPLSLAHEPIISR